MHSANHELGDKINKDSGVSDSVQGLEQYLKEKEDE
jgi:hypothetical protein